MWVNKWLLISLFPFQCMKVLGRMFFSLSVTFYRDSGIMLGSSWQDMSVEVSGHPNPCGRRADGRMGKSIFLPEALVHIAKLDVRLLFYIRENFSNLTYIHYVSVDNPKPVSSTTELHAYVARRQLVIFCLSELDTNWNQLQELKNGFSFGPILIHWK